MFGRCALTVVAALLLLTGSALRANSISPGQSGVTPDVFPYDYNIIWESAAPSPTFSFDGGLTTFKYVEAVGTDPANPYCSTCLDFAFIFNVTDPNNFITSVDLSDFAGFATDGGYTQVGTNPIDPDSVSRSTNGSTLDFTYSVGVLPGDHSALLIVKTNAKNFDYNGVATLVDNNGASLALQDFVEPTTAPEPTSAALLGLGVVVLASFRKKLLRAR